MGARPTLDDLCAGSRLMGGQNSPPNSRKWLNTKSKRLLEALPSVLVALRLFAQEVLFVFSHSIKELDGDYNNLVMCQIVSVS